MINIRVTKWIAAVFISMAFIANSFADVAVIVHPSISDTASTKEISRLFLGKSKSLPGGQKVKAVGQTAGSAVSDEFNEKVLGKSQSQLKSYWSKLIFTGKGQPPAELDGDAAVIAKVSSDPGSIGYVSQASVTDAVKVLATF